MRRLPFVQTAVFADSRYAFSGNQLATFWDAKTNSTLTSEEMLGITREMNYSETTFIEESGVRGCAGRVRIFTPGGETPFAGHPTLGTAFVMRSKGLINRDASTAQLELGVGPIQVDFPSEELVCMRQRQPQFSAGPEDIGAVLRAIGLRSGDLDHEAQPEFGSTGFPFLIVPLRSLGAVRSAVPNPTGIRKSLSGRPSQEIVILARETIHSDSHIHVRMFAPEVGVLEDPATGSAAGPTAAYLERHHLLHDHKDGTPIVIEQGYSVNRPSRLIAEVQESGVLVSGKVRMNIEGTFLLK